MAHYYYNDNACAFNNQVTRGMHHPSMYSNDTFNLLEEVPVMPQSLSIQNLLKTNLNDVKNSLHIVKHLCDFTRVNNGALIESSEDNFILNEMELTVKDLQYYIQLIKNIMKSRIDLEKGILDLQLKEYPSLLRIRDGGNNFKALTSDYEALSFSLSNDLDVGEQSDFLKEFRTLKEECIIEEQMLALHMREHVVGKKTHHEILKDTTSYLRSFSSYHANLLESASLRDTESYSETDRICIVKFNSASLCRQVKEAFTRHIRDINRKGKAPYEDVQGFVISSPIGVRELKRSLKAAALELEGLVNFKLPLYIGTPVLNLCGGRFSKFADEIKNELIGRTVCARNPNLSDYKVLTCESYIDSKGQSVRSVTWLTVKQAYRLCMDIGMVEKLDAV